jgi:thymidylate kinase
MGNQTDPQRLPRLLALEGPDASGKTSIAQALAERLGGRYVKPFDGNIGLLIRWLHERRDYELANRISLAAVTRVVEQNRDVPWLIFDRHWVSVLAFIPREFAPTWMPPPSTIVCLADKAIISGRLAERGEPPEELLASDDIVARFQRLAEEFGLPTLDTGRTTVESAVEQLLAHPLIAGETAGSR